MARYDKADPYGGTFRAYLAADWDGADAGKPYGVGFDATGKLVKGAGVCGMKGILILTNKHGHKVRDGQVDVMRFGCVTDFAPTAGEPGVDFGTASTNYFADPTTGVITAHALPGVTGSYYVGHTQEKDRLEVEFSVKPTP